MRSIGIIACSFLLLHGRVFAQAGGTKPAFEVASVKRSIGQGADGMVRGGPGTSDPARIIYINVPLRMALMRAYGLDTNDQLEGPDWINTERYNIVANIPAGTNQEQCNQMLQNLLVQRLQMVVRHMTRQTGGYRLTLGKNGSKLKASPEGAPPSPVPDGFPPPDAAGIGVAGGDGTYRLTARHQSTSFLLQLLSVQLHAEIDDQTGLSGRYDYNLGFVPAQFLGTNQDHRFPDLKTAVEDQLGLKLVEENLPVEVVVVEKASPEPLQD